VIQCAETHEIPLSRPIAKGVSWSDVTCGQLLHW